MRITIRLTGKSNINNVIDGNAPVLLAVTNAATGMLTQILDEAEEMEE
jgi:hypothetical protein